MKEIIINSPKYGQYIALIDEEDYEVVSQYKWSLEKGDRTFYAKSKSYEYIDGAKIEKRISMHRLIMGLTNPKIEVDHKNHNGLDNRRENLRICNRKNNGKNLQLKINNTSGFKGVNRHKQANK